MAKSTRRQKAAAEKAARKRRSMVGGGKSRYALKHRPRGDVGQGFLDGVNVSDLTSAGLVAAFQGREGAGLAVLREASAALEETLRQRALACVQEAVDAGISLDGIATALKTNGAATPPPKRMRAPATKPEAPEDNCALLRLPYGIERYGLKWSRRAP